jgi:rare lipoprotein A (peptidoglycan hydrolase)
MIGRSAVMRRPPALYATPRAISLAPASQWPAISISALGYRNLISPSKIAAAMFACAAATLAIMISQQAKREMAGSHSIRNETIVFRWAGQRERQSNEIAISGDEQNSDETVPSNFPLVIRTVRFTNPGATQKLAANADRPPTGRPYMINGRTYVPTDNSTYRAEGIASWYGPDFHGRRTANGERYDMHGISAAHRTMPLPSYARITNLANGRSIIVRVNNRGPFVRNRIVDLSIGTAKALDFYSKGTAHVRVEFVGRAPAEGGDDQTLLATLRVGTPAPAPSTVIMASAKPLLAKRADGKEIRPSTEQ